MQQIRKSAPEINVKERKSGRNSTNRSDKNLKNRQKSNKTINDKDFDENDDLHVLKLKYIQMKKDRLHMEKNVDVLENKIKILGVEENRAKKHIEREIKGREENLKTINEIAQQKDDIIRAKIEQNNELKKNMTKI